MIQEFNLVLAGGSLSAIFNDTKSEDWDLFYVGNGDFDAMLARFQQKYPYRTKETWNPDCFSCWFGDIKVQLVNNGKRNPIEILNEFDMHQCMIAWDGQFMYADKVSLKAMLEKKIRFHRVEYPIVALKRLLKYHDKGYKMEDDDMQDFLEKTHTRLLTHDLVDPNSTKESVWRSYLRG